MVPDLPTSDLPKLEPDPARLPELQLSGLADVWGSGLVNLSLFFTTTSLQDIADLKKRIDAIDLRGTLHAEDVSPYLKFQSRKETQRLLAVLRRTPFEIVKLLTSGAFEQLGQTLKFKPRKGKMRGHQDK